MKTIMLKEKWARMIACGLKTLETRTWTTKYRGKILIAASQPCGKIICSAEIKACRRMEKADEEKACVKYDESLFVWELENIKRTKEVSIKGRLGIFELNIQENEL